MSNSLFSSWHKANVKYAGENIPHPELASLSATWGHARDALAGRSPKSRGADVHREQLDRSMSMKNFAMTMSSAVSAFKQAGEDNRMRRSRSLNPEELRQRRRMSGEGFWDRNWGPNCQDSSCFFS